jgi:hypothetical protein
MEGVMDRSRWIEVEVLLSLRHARHEIVATMVVSKIERSAGIADGSRRVSVCRDTVEVLWIGKLYQGMQAKTHSLREYSMSKT